MTGEIPTEIRNCETHGQYESRNYLSIMWSGCPACAAEAAQRKAEEDAEKQKQREAQQWQAKLNNSGIPARFQTRTLDSYIAETPQQQRALTFARNYAEGIEQATETGRSAMLIGKPGTGKTHLAVGIGIDALRKGLSVKFVTVMSMIRAIKSTWAKGHEETESEAMIRFVNYDLLILDEVGVQFGSDFEKTILFEILNARYNWLAPTIVISNLDAAGVREHLGDRVYDRMRENGGKLMVFDWESYRGRVNERS
jgi:DNA replication protein DnaC